MRKSHRWSHQTPTPTTVSVAWALVTEPRPFETTTRYFAWLWSPDTDGTVRVEPVAPGMSTPSRYSGSRHRTLRRDGERRA
jgi:hypothetical protein